MATRPSRCTGTAGIGYPPQPRNASNTLGQHGAGERSSDRDPLFVRDPARTTHDVVRLRRGVHLVDDDPVVTESGYAGADDPDTPAHGAWRHAGSMRGSILDVR